MYFSDGKTNFGSGVRFDAPKATVPYSMIAADLNRDGSRTSSSVTLRLQELRISTTAPDGNMDLCDSAMARERSTAWKGVGSAWGRFLPRDARSLSSTNGLSGSARNESFHSWDTGPCHPTYSLRRFKSGNQSISSRRTANAVLNAASQPW